MASKRTSGETLIGSLEKKYATHFPSSPATFYREKLVTALNALLASSEVIVDNVVATPTPSQMSDTDTGRISQSLIRKLYGYDGSPTKPDNYVNLWNALPSSARDYIYSLMFHLIARRYPLEHPGLVVDSSKKRKTPRAAVDTIAPPAKKKKKKIATKEVLPVHATLPFDDDDDSMFT